VAAQGIAAAAELIRKEKIHGISLTGANLEEDVFNLVAHNSYRRVPNYRELRPEDEKALLDKGLNRVTDTCIPEEEAMRHLEHNLAQEWHAADRAGERFLPHEFFYALIRSGRLQPSYQIDPRDSWLLAACEKNLPVFVPGWEDSTLGNIYAGHCIAGKVKHPETMRAGVLAKYMAEELEQVYGEITREYGFEPPQRTQIEVYNKAKGLAGMQALFPGSFQADDLVRAHIGGHALKDREAKVAGIPASQQAVPTVAGTAIFGPSTEQVVHAIG